MLRIFLAMILVAGGGLAAASAPPALDHVIVGVDNLERGIEAIERMTGVRPVYGGSHPAFGTHNALLSLGEGRYLELIAPDPEAERLSPRATLLKSLHEPTVVGWIVAADDMEATRDKLRERGFETTEIEPGARELPDGSRLAWQLLFVTRPANPLLPAFIHWTSPGMHPSTSSPDGCTLLSFHLETPDPAGLKAQLVRADVVVDTSNGPKPRMAVSLSCPAGKVEL